MTDGANCANCANCAYLLFFQVEKDARSDDDLSFPEEEKPEINKHGDGVTVDNKKKQWSRGRTRHSLSFLELRLMCFWLTNLQISHNFSTRNLLSPIIYKPIKVKKKQKKHWKRITKIKKIGKPSPVAPYDLQSIFKLYWELMWKQVTWNTSFKFSLQVTRTSYFSFLKCTCWGHPHSFYQGWGVAPRQIVVMPVWRDYFLIVSDWMNNNRKKRTRQW